MFNPRTRAGETSHLAGFSSSIKKNCGFNKVWPKSCKFSALYFSRKSLLHKYLRKMFCKMEILNYITNCHYLTYNGTVVSDNKNSHPLFSLRLNYSHKYKQLELCLHQSFPSKPDQAAKPHHLCISSLFRFESYSGFTNYFWFLPRFYIFQKFQYFAKVFRAIYRLCP